MEEIQIEQMQSLSKKAEYFCEESTTSAQQLRNKLLSMSRDEALRQMKENLFSEVMKHYESKEIVVPFNDSEGDNNKKIETMLDDFMAQVDEQLHQNIQNKLSSFQGKENSPNSKNTQEVNVKTSENDCSDSSKCKSDKQNTENI